MSLPEKKKSAVKLAKDVEVAAPLSQEQLEDASLELDEADLLALVVGGGHMAMQRF